MSDTEIDRIDCISLRDIGVPVDTLTPEKIREIYDSLNPTEKICINAMVVNLRNGVEGRLGRSVHFGRLGALEVLIKLGILLYYRQKVG